MSFNITDIKEKARTEISGINSVQELENTRVKYLGRNGLLSEITGSIPALPKEERPDAGRKANELKNKLTLLLEDKARQLQALNQAIGQNVDITLPGQRPKAGTLHLITSTIEEVCAIFTSMGFAVACGPEVETEENNFTALNIPLDHPSRDAFDTFYLGTRDSGFEVRGLRAPSLGSRLLLRSHTSPAQARIMRKHKPPLAVIVPGKVYRPDATDASHSFMFHQVEGFLVDEKIKFSDLKGTLSVFIKKLFGEAAQTRFRPHFFPFTEPSAEVDISCIICKKYQTPDTRHQTPEKNESRVPSPESRKCSVCGGKGWLEILGCGMIHPNVFKNVGYPKGKYSGFAFGMGVDRIAMLKYGVDDIRLFYENDLRFLRQF